MSAPDHVRHPLHASTQGVQYGVDIKDGNGMLVGCVFGLAGTMLPTARAMAAGPELLAQLKFAVKVLSAIPAIGGTAQVEAMRAVIAEAEGGAL